MSDLCKNSSSIKVDQVLSFFLDLVRVQLPHEVPVASLVLMQGSSLRG